MALNPGIRIGVYEVTAQIGAGGMGQVFRATDTKLKRQVAIKILPPLLAADHDRLARFQREAEVLASLNHPHIAAIYGLEESTGVTALVMELVEGEDLSQRIARGALPLDEMLPIARQIAEALEAAHEQGIIHRDLKPANIKVRADGTVKVLDFGLAKALEPVVPSGVSQSPTITTPAMTQAGIILGTAAYMSPEQAKGRTADKRSDVWAFGCVLYEMLTGAAAFGGGDDTVSEVLAAVLKSEPDWSALPTSTPVAVETLLRRCLTKDPRERLHDIADARLEIRDVGTRRGDGAPTSARTNRVAWTLAVTFGVVALVLGSLLVRSAVRPSAPTAVYRSLILPPVGDLNAAASESRTGVPRARRGLGLALSPDGGHLAVVSPGPAGRLVLWVRPLDSVRARPLAGTEGAGNPFWSADGRYIAFVAEGKLKRVAASGGPVLTLSDRARNFSTGTWSRDNVILFVAADGSILRTSATAGDASPATSRDTSREGAQTSPFFLPDGRRFLYAVDAEDRTSGGVYLGSLDSSERVKLIDNAFLPAYASGFVLFVRDDTLMAQRFDAGRLALDGEPMAVAEQLRVAGAPGTSGVYAVSQSGVLVYQEGLIQKSALVWLDRGGRELATLSEPRGFSYVQLSPDERHLAVSVYDDATRTRDVYLFDTARGGQTRLTSEPSDDFSPAWSPHGDRLAFAGRRQGDHALNLYATNVSGTSGEKRLLDLDGVEIPTSWSPDERFLLFQTPSPGADIKVLSLADGQVSPLVSTRFTEGSAQFSPDGRWVAYSSNETGRTEVYLLPFQRAGPRVPISTDGGGSPRWRKDGKELFYIRGDNTLMAVAVSLNAASVDVGAASALFQSRFRSENFPYAVTSDGRFLVSRSVDDETTPGITLVVNWPATLRKD
ncbi:MAG TPA: protein kinase [Vicinamibacterales bacterium]|nr:protein kinase [Vicinamibacterales bacterium]